MIPYGLIPKELEANYCVFGQWDYVVGPLHGLGGDINVSGVHEVIQLGRYQKG